LDRQIIYAGQVPLETDLLSTNKNVGFALGQFAQDFLGTSTIFTGLACVPNTPAAMNVVVQPGAVYAQAALDATAYSSLAADSTVTQKQGILKTAQTFATPAPTTSGQSIVYLISASFLEADTNAVVLPYYNASNPAQAYSGPNGTGSSQNTLRQDTVQLTLTAGVPATTGSQLTPATPVGQVALYTITVAYGAATVVAGNIAKVSGAPIMSAPLASGRLLGVQTFLSSGTYTPTPGTTSVVVECQGAGGGSGGANSTGAGQVSMGGGGGSGVYGKGRYTSGFAGASVVVGAGGAAGGTGGNGGSTSFGALMTVGGGLGGPAGVPFTPPGGTARGLGGTTGSGGNIVSGAGQPSSTPIAFTTTTVLPSNGGASNFGSGGVAGITSAGAPGASVGSGAGGSYIGPSASAVNGAAGSSGIVIVWEYA
jgi:hypothetical protein